MGKQFKEVGANELCPCKSGKIYKDCCKKKNFKLGYRDGILTKSVPLKQEALQIINEQEQQFIDLYGRKPLEDDYLFPFYMISGNELGVEMVYTMRKAGIPEDKIYAYYKSDGLLPCEQNLDLLSEADLQEFDQFCKEYNEVMTAPLSNTINSVQFVSFANDYLLNIYEQTNQALIMVMNDFIRRHSKTDSFQDYEPSTVIEYCIFSSYKTIKTLKSIQKLQDEHMTESIYALSRGIFENYMYINVINQNSTFFEIKILPKVDTRNYSFVKRPDGTINYNLVEHNATEKRSNIRVYIAELTKYFVYSKDKELYELFYHTACQYVHVDVLSAKSYFHEIDPYDEIDPAIVASIISVTLAALLLVQVSRVDGIDMQFTKDITFLFNKMKPKLLYCFEIANSDPKYKNAVFNTFVERLQEEA